ncbi:MAG: group 1 truncated hemoglobin [Planctomycetales bacterium]|nr:group 1 truncated hemoglobin [Planctomycetales bacterium]
MTDSLFDRVGGADAVYRMVNTMYDYVLADPELSPFFEGAQLDRIRKMQFEFIAAALGGPIAYSGAEIQAVHTGRGITPHHFSKFVGHLAKAMEEQGAAHGEIDEMLGRIALYQDRIVGTAGEDG